MAKETYYFPHDFNPTSDPKMQALIGEFGAIGYGIYWRLVEMLHEDECHKLELKKYIYIALARHMSTSVEQIQTIVNTCINVYELFDSDGEYFWSNRVLRNIEKRTELSSKRSKAGKISAESRKNSTHVEHMSTHVEQVPTKERKEKERKEKEIKEDIREKPKRFSPPTLEDVTSYCHERKNTIDPQHFIDYNEARGWMVGKNKMKDWKATIRTWEQNGFSNNKVNSNGTSITTNSGYNKGYNANDPTKFHGLNRDNFPNVISFKNT